MRKTKNKDLKIALKLRYGDSPVRCLFCVHAVVQTLEKGIQVTCSFTQEEVDKSYVCPEFELDTEYSLEDPFRQ